MSSVRVLRPGIGIPEPVGVIAPVGEHGLGAGQGVEHQRGITELQVQIHERDVLLSLLGEGHAEV